MGGLRGEEGGWTLLTAARILYLIIILLRNVLLWEYAHAYISKTPDGMPNTQ